MDSTLPLPGKRPVIGLTVGDAAGIGPEVVAAALASGQLDAGFEYQIIGPQPGGVVPGKPSAGTARAAWQGLEEAVRGALRGDLAAVVSAPVCKASVYEIGF